jgi:hypothetical protein
VSILLHRIVIVVGALMFVSVCTDTLLLSYVDA